MSPKASASNHIGVREYRALAFHLLHVQCKPVSISRVLQEEILEIGQFVYELVSGEDADGSQVGPRALEHP